MTTNVPYQATAPRTFICRTEDTAIMVEAETLDEARTGAAGILGVRIFDVVAYESEEC